MGDTSTAVLSLMAADGTVTVIATEDSGAAYVQGSLPSLLPGEYTIQYYVIGVGYAAFQ